MKNIKNLKLNNKGMTLIECIISITILSICIIPLLNTFAFCYKYTSKAKIRQKATNVAQEVLETYKADSLDTVMNKIISTDASISADNVLNSGSVSYAEAYISTPSSTTPSVSLNDGTGYYLYSNITATGSNEKYDAIVKVTSGNALYDPSNATDTDNIAVFNTTSTDLFNGPEGTYVISQDSELFSKMLTTLSGSVSNQCDKFKNDFGWNNPCVIGISLKRNNVITYSATVPPETEPYVVKYESKYEFTISYRDMMPDASFDADPNKSKSQVVTFDKNDSGYTSYLCSEKNVQKLNSITFFYYPIYDDINTVSVANGYTNGSITQHVPITVIDSSDVLSVYNTVGQIDVNIYKQKIASVKSAADILKYAAADKNYLLNVTAGEESNYYKTGLVGNVDNNVYSSADTGRPISALTGIANGKLILGSVLDSSALKNNQLICVLDIYVFGHGEAGDLTTVTSYDAVTAIIVGKESRANVQATIVDNIEY